MKFVPVALALACLLFAGNAAQAQSFRPLPAVTTALPLGDDNNVSINLPFAVKMGAEAPYTAVNVTQNAQVRNADISDRTTQFQDFEARGDTGQANYGNSIVGGRTAFIATYADIGYCCGADARRANVQLVVIDRSDIAPGDFDLEVNTEGMSATSFAQGFFIDGNNVGLAGAPAFPAGPAAYRATWTFRGGLLTSGTGPTLVTTPPPVPTLSEWAMILFGLTLAGGAAFYIQRRRFV